MGSFHYGPDHPDDTFVPHAFAEHRVDLGEIRLNYAVAGSPALPALLLVPGQAESWWGYEKAMTLFQDRFQVYAVDLRGQGRSSRTPGRYTVDNVGNDLVRFVATVIRRPVVVSGNSLGGLAAAWLAAYGQPGTIRGACCEDPPFFHAEANPSCGQSIRQGIGPRYALWHKYLGDQWSIGDWAGMRAAAQTETPDWIAAYMTDRAETAGGEPPQNLKEYDPEWGRAFWTGTACAGCDHARMLAAVRTPVLITHHFRAVHEQTGALMGALSDLQADRARQLLAATGHPVAYRSLPTAAHSLHGQDPALFTAILTAWVATLPAASPAPAAVSTR